MKILNAIFLSSVLGFGALALAACDERVPTSDQRQNAAQEKLANQAVSELGLPAITNFQEKRTYKMILEMRDQAINTVTYITDMNGKLHKLCNSIGFGIPYATQYTNPQKIASQGVNYGYAILPQADPNGLFSPAGADGTWILCQNPKDPKQVRPVMVEPRLIISPFEIDVQ